jgi:hypothetical protein
MYTVLKTVTDSRHFYQAILDLFPMRMDVINTIMFRIIWQWITSNFQPTPVLQPTPLPPTPTLYVNNLHECPNIPCNICHSHSFIDFQPSPTQHQPLPKQYNPIRVDRIGQVYQIPWLREEFCHLMLELGYGSSTVSTHLVFRVYVPLFFFIS